MLSVFNRHLTENERRSYKQFACFTDWGIVNLTVCCRQAAGVLVFVEILQCVLLFLVESVLASLLSPVITDR